MLVQRLQGVLRLQKRPLLAVALTHAEQHLQLRRVDDAARRRDHDAEVRQRGGQRHAGRQRQRAVGDMPRLRLGRCCGCRRRPVVRWLAVVNRNCSRPRCRQVAVALSVKRRLACVVACRAARSPRRRRTLEHVADVEAIKQQRRRGVAAMPRPQVLAGVDEQRRLDVVVARRGAADDRQRVCTISIVVGAFVVALALAKRRQICACGHPRSETAPRWRDTTSPRLVEVRWRACELQSAPHAHAFRSIDVACMRPTATREAKLTEGVRIV